MKIYENKCFTLQELAVLNGTVEILKELQNLNDLNLKYYRGLIVNGRNNHVTFGSVMSHLTKGFFQIGGQGNKEPDLFHIPNEKERKERVRIETKAFAKNKPYAWVAKSTYFANNSGAQKLKQALPNLTTQESVRPWIMERNYNDDQYYCLTSTAKWNGNLSETEVFIIKTEDLIDCLSYDHNVSKPYCYANIEKVRAKCSPLNSQKIA
jgi:hypothetical protein